MNIRNIPREWLYTAIRILSLSALLFASMLAVDYYMTANTFCHAGASCEVVAKSEFGQKYGIFLPTLGLVAYSFFFLTSFFFSKTKWKVFGMSVRTFWIPLAIICCAIGALLFIIVQAIEINAFCWLCMGIDTSAILMVIPAVLLMLGSKSEQENRSTFLHPILWLAMFVGIVSGPLSWGAYHPPIIDTSAANISAEEFQAQIDKVPEFIRSKYVPGKVNVHEISSFGCPYCRRLHPVLTKLLAEYGDKINFERTTLPIHMSEDACAAYYCAQKEGKGDEFADCMFEEPPKDAASILKHAEHCEIPPDEFVACIRSEEAQNAVAADRKAVNECGFKGAPTVWIDAQSIVGFQDVSVYRQAIELNPIIRNSKASVEAADGPSYFSTKPVLFASSMVLTALLLLVGLGAQFSQRRKEEAVLTLAKHVLWQKASNDTQTPSEENIDSAEVAQTTENEEQSEDEKTSEDADSANDSENV